jgi:hypothetical protein
MDPHFRRFQGTAVSYLTLSDARIKFTAYTMSALLYGLFASPMFACPRTVSSSELGIYVPITLITFRTLRRRMNASLAYAGVMFAVTTTWFALNTIVDEAVEDGAYDPENKRGSYCSPINISSTIFSSLVFAGSDVILVRTYMWVTRKDDRMAKERHSSTEHMCCGAGPYS